MTESANVRLRVYSGAALALLWPIGVLALASRETSLGADFVLGAAALVLFIAIARWDIVGYPWPLLFLLCLLLMAYQRGGWPTLLLCLGVFWYVRVLLRRFGPKAALDLQFPLRSGVYSVAHGGRYRVTNHHWASRSQRYALDIVRLDVFGMRAAGLCPRKLDRFQIFADVLYSPCSGVVTAAVGGLPDLPPGEMDRRHPAGNHVALRCDDDADAYVWLAHLACGSLRVKAGDHVAAGQELGQVGNSGHTSEPHLHIQAKRGGNPASLLDGEGVPMRFRGRWLIRSSLILSPAPRRTRARRGSSGLCPRV